MYRQYCLDNRVVNNNFNMVNKITNVLFIGWNPWASQKGQSFSDNPSWEFNNRQPKLRLRANIILRNSGHQVTVKI